MMKIVRLIIVFVLEINIFLAFAYVVPYPFLVFPFLDNTYYQGLAEMWNDRVLSPEHGVKILTKYAENGDIDAKFAIARYNAGNYHTSIEKETVLPFEPISKIPGEGEYYIALDLETKRLTSCSPDEKTHDEVIFLMNLSASKGYWRAKSWMNNYNIRELTK